MTPTESELAELEKKWHGATPGKWHRFWNSNPKPKGASVVCMSYHGQGIYTDHEGGMTPSGTDDFIVAAHESWLDLLSELARLRRVEALHRSALSKITQREGPYSVDQLTHAGNCIEAMASVAQQALDGTYVSDDDESAIAEGSKTR